MDFSLQLWSVKDELAKDFQGGVKKLGELGYAGVEFAGYGGLSAAEMKTLLDEAGLYSVGSHTPFEVMRDSFEEDLAFHKEIGSKYIICPCADISTPEKVDEIIAVLNKISPMAKEAGIKVGYHNHQNEFKKIDGKYILDIIAENTDDNVIIELDVFWAAFAGVDPLEYIQKLGKKIELIHIKQIGANQENVEVAEGDINMREVIDTAKYAKFFVVEQEGYTKPVWEVTKNNIDYLKGI